MTERVKAPEAAKVRARLVITCSVDGCERPRGEAKGLCHSHYNRMRRDGDVRADVPIGKLKSAKAAKPCTVEGCDRKAESRGWCQSHYMNWWTRGDPTVGLVQRHYGRGTPEHRSWSAMKSRCDNPDNKNYPNYGGRGITYTSTWADFPQFLADMGPRPDGTSLDRIDNDGNYEPSNCRWATPKEQANNRRRPMRRQKGSAA